MSESKITEDLVTTDLNLIRHIKLLIDDVFELETVAARDEGSEPDVLLNAMGFVFATAECVRGYLDGPKSNRIARGILARSAFELGVTCVWLCLNGADGFAALEYDQKRQKRALANEMAGSRLFDELAETVERVKLSSVSEKAKLAGEAQYLNRMIASLDSAGSPLYAIYRMYSEFAHASLGVANSYVELDPASSSGMALVFPAVHKTLSDDIATAVSPFVWAVNAVNRRLPGAPFTKRLAMLQVMLGTSIDFELADRGEGTE